MAMNKKKLFIITGIITTVTFAVIFVLLLIFKVFTAQIEAFASTATGMDVRIKGGVAITLFPGFGLSLKEVKARNKGLDVVTIEKMRIELKLMSLSKFEININQVEIIKPVFYIVTLKSGTFNLEKPGRTLWEKLPAVEKISISQGSLFYTDEKLNKNIEIGGLDSDIKNFFHGGTDSWSYKNISFTGDVRCKILKIDNLRIVHLTMRAAVNNGILNVDPVSMKIFGGTGNGSIHADVTEPSPHYRLVYSLNQVRIEELLQQYSYKEIQNNIMEGPINFTGDLTAMGKNAAEVKRSLNGNLSLNGENLVLNNIDIDSLITKFEQSQNLNLLDVGAFLLMGPLGPVLTKGYNFASLYEESQGGKGTIKKLVSVWEVKDGIAMANDVAFSSKKRRVAMKGGLNFINERFVNVTLAALDERGCAVYSEKVYGRFKNPRIEKKSAFKSITGSLVNPLKDALDFLQGDECTVFYLGSVAQP